MLGAKVVIDPPTESRPDTAATDPFASPISSPSASIRRGSATNASYDTITTVPRTPTESSTTSLRPIINLPPGPSASMTKPKAARMRSHMLPDDKPLHKPWNEKRNPRAVFSYYLTYIMVLVGVAVGVIQCYFGYTRVVLDKQPLCLVFEEDFSNEEKVFGENGSFFREVNMDGFGYALLCLPSYLSRS